MNNEELKMNNEEYNVGAGLVPAQNNHAITLIALVITIIILLILAGVTISVILGDNGLFSTAKRAAGNYLNEQEKELGLINQIGNTINKEVGEEEKEKDYNAEKKVNKPVTAGTGLIPVTINANGTLNVVSSNDGSWYDYIDTSVEGKANKSKWANAKTTDGSLWVWIPRYAYKITYTNTSDKSKGGIVDVVFLKDDTNKDFKDSDVTDANYVDEKGNKGAYIVHPAFRDGSASGLNNGYANGEWNDEITGFWMAKFEAGYAGEAGNKTSAQDSTVSITVNNLTTNYYGARAVGDKIKYPVFRANKPSVNRIGISDSFDLCRSLTSPNNPYGLTNRVNSHLTKNSEWGAVAYLTHSKYGINGQEVRINNVNANDNTVTDGTNTIYGVTGYGAATDNAKGDTSRKLAQLTVQNAEGSWTTTRGQTASSTKNIYGIYDLSGGEYEWTAGYIAPTTGNYVTYGGSLQGESNQYKSKYAGTDSENAINYNETANQTRIGEAIWETSSEGNASNKSWNGDYSYFGSLAAPFAMRGGHYGSASYAGVFAFARLHGTCVNDVGFRPVLVVNP